jgi:hypothetical protein
MTNNKTRYAVFHAYKQLLKAQKQTFQGTIKEFFLSLVFMFNAIKKFIKRQFYKIGDTNAIESILLLLFKVLF